MPAVGSHVPQAKNGGSWKNWSNFWGRHSGSWKKPLSVHVKSGGNWVKVWDERPIITITSNYYNTIDGGGSAPPASRYTTIFVTYFTVEANGFNTTISTGTPGASLSSTSVSANTTSGSVSCTFEYVGSGTMTNTPSNYPIIIVANSSGMSQKQYSN